MTNAWLSRVGTAHEPQGRGCSEDTGRKKHGVQKSGEVPAASHPTGL